MTIHWFYYPKSKKPPRIATEVVRVFKGTDGVDSQNHNLKSNEVLALIADGLCEVGFRVERGRKRVDAIEIPVLFGKDGVAEKSFRADAFHESEGFVLEVEAGRGFVNNQFLKDLFQACMMYGVSYLGIALRKQYANANDFDNVCRFFDTLYASQRLTLPLDGILVIGY